MGFQIVKHTKLTNHIRFNLSKSQVEIRRTVSIPGNGVHFSTHYKTNQNNEEVLPSTKDQNYKKLGIATNKLYKLSLKIFIVFIFLDLITFRNKLFLYVVVTLEAIIFIGTFNSIYKKYKICNKENTIF